MNRNISFFTGILAVLSMCMVSCMDDKGNYDYHPINEIDIKGIEPMYELLQGDSLTIIPQLTSSMAKDESSYTYEWIYIRNNRDPYDKSFPQKDTFACTRNLDKFQMAFPADEYKIYYYVTDTITNVKYHHAFQVKLSSSNYEGYLVLNDIDGKMRLDMLSYRNNTFYQIEDVLKALGSGVPEQTGPLKIACFTDNKADGYGIYLLNESSCFTIHPTTFQYTTARDIGWRIAGSTGPGFLAQNIVSASGSMAALYADGNVYNYCSMLAILWGIPLNTLDGGLTYFKTSPQIASNGSSGGYVVFNEDNKTFYRFGRADSKVSAIPKTDPKAEAAFYNTNKDLLYMSCNYNGYPKQQYFAIQKDPVTQKCYITRFYYSGEVELNEEILGTDISSAECFAVSNEQPTYLFYNVGSKIYEYDTSLKQSKLMLDVSPDKVTVLKFQEFAGTKYKDFMYKLSVCTYNESSKNGKMAMYTVPPVNGDLVLYKSWEGFGKIVSFDFRTR